MFYLDASGINTKYHHQKIPHKVALDNLALFIAQFELDIQDKFIAKLGSYFDKITYLDNSAIKNDINKYKKYVIKKSNKFFQNRVADYKKKIFRDCSEFIAYKADDFSNNKIKGVFNRNAFYANQEFFEKFINNPESFKKDITKYFKKGNTAQVFILDSGSEKFVIKYYKVKNIFHSIKNYFRSTRAAKSWLCANICKFIGVKTVEPVGYFEAKKTGRFQGAYFITKNDPSLNDLNNILDKGSKLKINVIANNIVDNIRVLKKNRVYHGDFKIYNMLADANKIGNNFFIIDLEQMKQVSNEKYFNYLHSKDYNRMLKSLDGYKDIKNLVIEKMKVK